MHSGLCIRKTPKSSPVISGMLIMFVEEDRCTSRGSSSLYRMMSANVVFSVSHCRDKCSPFLMAISPSVPVPHICFRTGGTV